MIPAHHPYIHEGLMETILLKKNIYKGERLPHVEKVYETVHGTLISRCNRETLRLNLRYAQWHTKALR